MAFVHHPPNGGPGGPRAGDLIGLFEKGAPAVDAAHRHTLLRGRKGPRTPKPTSPPGRAEARLDPPTGGPARGRAPGGPRAGYLIWLLHHPPNGGPGGPRVGYLIWVRASTQMGERGQLVPFGINLADAASAPRWSAQPRARIRSHAWTSLTPPSGARWRACLRWPDA
jgi:hypothetical protein